MASNFIRTSGRILSLLRTRIKPVCGKCSFRHELIPHSPIIRALSLSSIKSRYVEDGVAEIGDTHGGSMVFTRELVNKLRNLYTDDLSTADKESDEISLGMLFW